MTFRFVRLASLSLALAGVAASLTGCFPLVAGGAAIGTMVAVDRRTSGAQLEDEGIELRASARLRDAMGERAHVNVTSYNRQALLTGEVPNERDKQTAEQIVSRVENVKSVVNDLAVMGNSTLAQRSSDTLVTGRVRASLVDDKELYAGAFRVVTERGTTYLMGRVTQREADHATTIARSVPGVQRVVRLFEIITDDELRQIAPQQTRPANAAPAR
jgi:osmotically-inducible protein OsmY